MYESKDQVPQWSLLSKERWRWLACLGVLAVAFAVIVVVLTSREPVLAVGPGQLLSSRDASSPLTLTCRLGYAVTHRPLSNYGESLLTSLRGGTYLNYDVVASPPSPIGIEFLQVVGIHQAKNGNQWNSPYVVPYTYTVDPSLSTIAWAASQTPGALWLVGNEPDRRDWPYSTGDTGTQDEMVPELYAQAYHEIYTVIKSADPTARVANAGLIEATPLRLEYLDRMWNAYVALYGNTMPVDVWNMHEFILPENADPAQFGAGVPAGIDAPGGGTMYSIADVVSPTIYRQHIMAMRTWLASKGQRDKPLLISERGVMPDWLNDDKSVTYFMTTTFDFTLNHTDASIGYPSDGGRLVQGMIWYSLDDDRRDSDGYLYWGGHLVNSTSRTLDPLGVTWYNYVQNSAPQSQPDLLPVRIWQWPVPLAMTGTVSATVVVDVVNVGNIGTGSPFSVTLRDSNGDIIDSQTMPATGGCGMTQRQLSFTIPSLVSGVHTVSVWVDSFNAIPESNEANNVLTSTVLVATWQTYLPLVLKAR